MFLRSPDFERDIESFIAEDVAVVKRRLFVA